MLYDIPENNKIISYIIIMNSFKLKFQVIDSQTPKIQLVFKKNNRENHKMDKREKKHLKMVLFAPAAF